MNQTDNTGIECPKCEGSGKNPSRAVRGRITTGSTSTNACPKCGGKGRLYPVKVEMKPADIRAEAQSG